MIFVPKFQSCCLYVEIAMKYVNYCIYKSLDVYDALLG